MAEKSAPMERLSLYNTLSKKTEEFVPNVPGKIRMYMCGPTVYDSPHIGHARTYIAFDVVRRILAEYFGYDVTLVMNITDIDDKIIARAEERGVACGELAARYEGEFFAAMDRLGVRRPDFVTRVTEYVPACVRFVERLEEQGLAYAAGGSVYFDLAAYRERFAYNLLRPKTVQEEPAEPAHDKRGREDFVLWKSSRDNEPAYETRWGPGRPGWHIECSAMSTAVFGPTLDIHAGGIDLAFPHHENEIAQCQGHSGRHWVNYVLHTGHLNIDGLKMSKSLKNFLTIDGVLQEASACSLRIMFLQHPWNRDMSYDREQLAHADAVGRRILNFVSNAESLLRRADRRALSEQDLAVMRELEGRKDAVHAHFANNLNTARALEEMLALISAVNAHMKALHTDVLGAAYRFVARLAGIFGIAREGGPAGGPESGVAEVLNQYRYEVRRAARMKSPTSVFFELSDRVREEVRQYNYVIDDGHDGSVIRRV